MSASAVVGISTFNRADILSKAIESAQSQSHRPLRISVLDDASNDTTPSLRPNFPDVSWERFEQNQGLIRARNRLMSVATENYYVSLDDDAWFLLGDEIALAVDYMEKHPRVAAIAFDMLSPDRPDPVPRGQRLQVGMYYGCGHVLRMSAVRELGGYSQFPGVYGVEEKDFCLRLMDYGYEVIKLVGVHIWHDKSLLARNEPKQQRSGVYNDMTLTLWRMPGSQVLQTLVWKAFSHIRFGLTHRLLGASLLGLVDFVRAIGRIIPARKPVSVAAVKTYRRLSRAPRQI